MAGQLCKDLYEVLAVEFYAWEVTLAELLRNLTLQDITSTEDGP